MHNLSPLTGEPPVQGVDIKRVRQAGFSLVEVTMAIGIVAFAFVALLGLLPTGLGVFRQSIDSANQMWIMQNLNSMVQVTPWDKIPDLEKFTFYFDEEARLTDRVSPEGGEEADQERIDKRLYAVKLLVTEPVRPGDDAKGTQEQAYSQNVLRVVGVIAPYVNPVAMKEFEAVKDIDDLTPKEGKRTELQTQAFLVTRMESMVKAPNP
jgi:uncharacterized protein (TIGR02598 family)